ncbi:MAG: hypothetical protein KatS3mg102_2561 [Planctomycetota bacterium]|nr:MAG: hypothetical protein KatS3mg102_2561 [Planctomycetota bacterium]
MLDWLLAGSSPAGLGLGGALLALASLGASVAWTVRVVLCSDLELRARRREDAIRRALEHYLRREYAAALEGFEAAGRLGLQGGDADIAFFLGATEARLGNARAARRLLRRAAAWDLEGKWRHEVERELSALAGGPPIPPPRRTTAAALRLPLRSWATEQAEAAGTAAGEPEGEQRPASATR